jgi:hypothetical protein
MGVERNIPKLAAIIAVLQLVTALVAGSSGVEWSLSSLWGFSQVAKFENEFLRVFKTSAS